MYKKIFEETLIYGIGTILPRIINYSFLKLFTSFLDKKSFSLYTDMYSISFLVISILTFGFESSYFRFLYKQKNTKHDKIFSISMISILIISLTFLFVSIFFLKKISYFSGYKNHKEYFLIFFLIIFFDTISSLPMAWLRIHRKVFRYVFIRITSICIQSFITFWLLSNNSKSPENFLSFLNIIKKYTDKPGYIFYANMISSIINFILLFDIITKIHFKKFQIKFALKMINYGLPIMLGTLTFAINENLDKILIKRWISDEINSSYSACYRIASFISLYTTAFRLGIEPFYFKKSKESNAKEVYKKLTYLFTLFGIIFFVLLWSNINWISKFIIGVNYKTAQNIIPIIMIANLFLGIYINLSIAYKIKDRPIIGTYISLIGTLITILSNLLLLIPGLGYMVSAWGTLLSYGSMMLISYWWGQKNYKIDYPITRLIYHFILAILIGYLLGEKFPHYNFIGQLLYLYIIFLIEKSKLIKIFT